MGFGCVLYPVGGVPFVQRGMWRGLGKGGVCIFWSMEWMENASFVGIMDRKYDLYESIVQFLLGDM